MLPPANWVKAAATLYEPFLTPFNKTTNMKVHVTHISLVPSLRVALSEKQSGEQSQILLAYYLKVVRPNGITRLAIIT